MTLKLLPCRDSDDLARARQAELDIDRHRARQLGLSAVESARAGWYAADGVRVDWSETIATARDRKVSIPPDAPLPEPTGKHFAETEVEVANETTLVAARGLTEKGRTPLALNFANGLHPGGGFLSGSRAQEENLCRSSALFETLIGDEMYQAHARRPEPDSTDWAILSPDVPVFRSDDGVELARYWTLSFLTCAAPVVGRVTPARARGLLKTRIDRVLSIARAYGYESIVLGAWGCGAFGNDPVTTANDFRDALESKYADSFRDVVFAVSDWSPERRFLGPFRDAFSGEAGEEMRGTRQ